MAKTTKKTIEVENRKAHFLYFLSEFTVAGIVLSGTEIKSIRAGNVNLTGAFVHAKNGELFVVGMRISAYQPGSMFNKDEYRDRKLLLTKHEIRKFSKALEEEGMSCVPTKLFIQRGYCKLEIALAKGKKAHDKRDAIKERDTKRKVARAMREGVKADGE